MSEPSSVMLPLLTGCWPALRRPQPPQPPEPAVARRSAAEMVGLSAS